MCWVGVFFCLSSILKKKKKQDFEPNATGYLQTPPPKNRRQSVTGAVFMTKGWLIFIGFSHNFFLHAIDEMVSSFLRSDSPFIFQKKQTLTENASRLFRIHEWAPECGPTGWDPRLPQPWHESRAATASGPDVPKTHSRQPLCGRGHGRPTNATHRSYFWFRFETLHSGLVTNANLFCSLL